jgi:hypothetical protein
VDAGLRVMVAVLPPGLVKRILIPLGLAGAACLVATAVVWDGGLSFFGTCQ